MKQGKLLVIEGLDGSGKTTQFQLLQERMEREGIASRFISFPDYSEPSSALVTMYLGGEFGSEPGDVNAYAASSFYAVDRFASYKKFWEADYRAGKTIVSARYTTSNALHQMGKLPREEWDEYLRWLCDYEYRLLGLPRPDLTVYLDLEPALADELLAARYAGDESKRDIHERDRAYLRQCRECARYAAGPLGFRVISCGEGGKIRSREDIAGELWALAKGIL